MTSRMPERTAMQALLDKQAIHDVLLSYCRGVDRSDEALLRSVYHPDAYDDHGTSKGNAWQFVKDLTERMRTAGQPTMHTLSNVLIDVDRDVAHAESYIVAYHRRNQEGAPSDFVFGGRYIDRFERRQGEWRIAHRVVVHEWSRIDPVMESWPSAGQFTQGHRSHEDLVYER